MSRLSDHVRRDAEHAARSMARIEVQRYLRRIDDLAKAYVAEAIEEATNRGELIDGTELGKAQGARALRAYIGAGEPQAAIESESS